MNYIVTMTGTKTVTFQYEIEADSKADAQAEAEALATENPWPDDADRTAEYDSSVFSVEQGPAS